MLAEKAHARPENKMRQNKQRHRFSAISPERKAQKKANHSQYEQERIADKGEQILPYVIDRAFRHRRKLYWLQH